MVLYKTRVHVKLLLKQIKNKAINKKDDFTFIHKNRFAERNKLKLIKL